MGKFCRLIFVVFLSTSIFADTHYIDVEKYLSTDMDFIFEIENEYFDKVKLDCQGFINGVYMKHHNGHEQTLVLDIGECEDIHRKIVTNIRNSKSSCLFVDLERRKYSLTSQKCH